ncbi:MAG: RES domain-containing protein [Bacteroidales bacterium]|nr:RES domain-containing protein [Bacteroidales bacterium]
MTFEELLKDSIFDLPLSQKSNKSFDVFISELLNDFLNKVNQLDNQSLQFEDIRIEPESIKSTQSTIVEGLIEVVQEYYNGNPFKAYDKLDHTLKNEVKDLYAIIKQKEYCANENFYRIRLKEDNFPLDAKDLFHIPFEHRGKVSTQRYSIPGFPSLYLGRTLYVCWEELNRPQIDKFQAVRLKNKSNISFLDLTPPLLTNNLHRKEVYRYFMTWPLIACCSVKVKNINDTFKPEYIIPQLLLQWVRDNDRIDGISYKSTHIEPQLYKQEGELSNLVLPVKENREKGHCSKLKSKFEMTEVVSWQLYQYALGGQLFEDTFDGNRVIDAKLPLLELIKGRKYPYGYSILGNLEKYLDGMNTKKIK